MTLSEAARVYEVGGHAAVGRVLVTFDPAKSLSKAVRRLGPAMADFPDDEIWNPFSLRARRIARELAGTPLARPRKATIHRPGFRADQRSARSGARRLLPLD
jgi:hypothetical protein